MLDPEQIRANYAAVASRVRAACERAGRGAGEVTIVAVSKTFPAEAATAAIAAGALENPSGNRDKNRWCQPKPRRQESGAGWTDSLAVFGLGALASHRTSAVEQGEGRRAGLRRDPDDRLRGARREGRQGGRGGRQAPGSAARGQHRPRAAESGRRSCRGRDPGARSWRRSTRLP